MGANQKKKDENKTPATEAELTQGLTPEATEQSAPKANEPLSEVEPTPEDPSADEDVADEVAATDPEVTDTDSDDATAAEPVEAKDETPDMCQDCLASPGLANPTKLCPTCGGTPSRKERERLATLET